MPRACTVCCHPDCSTINADIVSGESLRFIAGHYGIAATTLQRHAQHIPAQLAKAQAAVEVAAADTLLEQIGNLSTRARSILDKAETGGDMKTALAAIREVRATLELIAKVTGELSNNVSSVTVNMATTRRKAEDMTDDELADIALGRETIIKQISRIIDEDEAEKSRLSSRPN